MTSYSHHLILHTSIFVQSQLTSNSSSLAASRDEAKQLQTQLKSALKTADHTADDLRKQHVAVVKSLEEKVYNNV